jgi:iron complex outermembrane recepter protein
VVTSTRLSATARQRAKNRSAQRMRASVFAVCAAYLLTAPFILSAHAAAPRDLADLSLEQLGNIEVTSVSKRSERLSEAAASIFVITGDDIRRAGVRTLPEALRLAPNLQVARANTGSYAISARGFNNAIGNKLLVLIDGRTVYTPLFSGVFWDQQDILLEDVERIEVISGPGGALWGVNAVNGVINVITRAAGDTQGTLMALGAGNRDEGAAVRYGGRIGAGHYRVYGKTTEQQNTHRANGTSAPDGRQFGQVGLRADWRDAKDSYTFQGDAYSGKGEFVRFGALVIPPVTVSGANVLARWTRQLSADSDFRVQAYLDHADRDDPLFFRPRSDIFDLELQHGMTLGDHRVLWGGGYRRARDDVGAGLAFSRFIPENSQLDWLNLFVQDEYRLTPTVELTAGVKFERNDYTGWESLPSVRLAWKPDERKLVWGAVSRAVRAPSRFDRDVFFPPAGPPFALAGGPNFQSEIANVFELGYRAQPVASFNYSVTAFRHDWQRVRGATRPPLPLFLDNSISGFVNGVEAWATLQPLRSWRLSGGVTSLHEKLTFGPGNNAELANDPDQWWTLRSSHSLSGRQELDVMVRRVGSLPLQGVPAYTAIDARWGWRMRPDTELSLTLQNLLDREHAEFGALPARSEFGRSFFVKLLWRI